MGATLFFAAVRWSEGPHLLAVFFGGALLLGMYERAMLPETYPALFEQEPFGTWLGVMYVSTAVGIILGFWMLIIKDIVLFFWGSDG